MQIEPGFRVPQNFLYMQNLPRLRACLDRAALDEVLLACGGPIKLQRLDLVASQKASFVSLVKEHVSRAYSETGRPYAEKLIAISEAGDDPEGFLTLSKHVCCLRCKGRLVGFAVPTMKLGGSIKTGPVILGQGQK